MSKTTFTGYVPSLKAKHEATITNGKAIESKGGSIRYTIQGEYEGRKTFPKTVSKHDFENVYGFDAKEAEAVIVVGKDKKSGNAIAQGHVVGLKDKTGFEPLAISTVSKDEMMKGNPPTISGAVNHADTVGSPSPASVEPPAPSEKPFPQEPSNENFSAEMEEWNYVNFEETQDGLKLTSNGLWGDDVENAADLLEDVRANSDWEWLTADQLGALSEADVLAQGSYSDDGEFEPTENVVYAYTDYQISHWFEELQNNGVVVFKPFPISQVKEATTERVIITLGDDDEEDEEEIEEETEDEDEDEEDAGSDEKEEDSDSDEEKDEKVEDEDEEQEEEDSEEEDDEDEDEDEEEFEAISVEVEREKKEDKDEDEDEDGLLTPMNVALGLGAVALGVAVLGAEGVCGCGIDCDCDCGCAESGVCNCGESCPCDCGCGVESFGTDSLVEEPDWIPDGDGRALGQQNLDINLSPLHAEQNEYHTSNVFYADEDVQKMTSSEFVPFDQITSEIQQEWDETTAPIAADYEPLDEPTNANFSAEEEDYEILYEKVEDALHKHLESQMHKGKSLDIIVEDADAYAIVEEVIPHYHKYHAPLSSDVEAMLSETDWEEVYSAEYGRAETVGSPSPTFNEGITGQDGPSAEPTNADFSANWSMGGRMVCESCGDKDGEYYGGDEYLCRDCVSEPLYDAETAGLSKNAQYAIGLAALGVGIALWNGDWVSKMFDRFKR